ncbi:MAG TPA: hypothetical protein VIL07_11925 [Symbiobacteriaceae bacterium]
MRCPNCAGRSIGRVGTDQYYCWDCCVEFKVGKGTVRVYHLDVDGELVAATEHPQAEAAAGAPKTTIRRR